MGHLSSKNSHAASLFFYLNQIKESEPPRAVLRQKSRNLNSPGCPNFLFQSNKILHRRVWIRSLASTKRQFLLKKFCSLKKYYYICNAILWD